MGRTGKDSRKIAVLMGGRSAEREVSLSSGRACTLALREAGFDAQEIDAGADLSDHLRALAPDVVFNALHGRWGEDGCVQGLLEWMEIPYTHSGVLASAMAMDKARSKEVFRAAGLPLAEGRVASATEIASAHVLPPPYVVKPVNEGSSVGVHIVRAGANAPVLGPNAPARMMVESYVPGRELTVSVLGDRSLTVTDIVTGGWYDYDAKYVPGGSHHVVPAQLPDEVFDACMAHALVAHDALGCRGLSRSDFRWDESRGIQGLVLLEINTQPGMTATSLAPEQARHVGIPFPELCRWLVEDASCGR